MGDTWRVTKDDSEDLGFAKWCLTSAAIEHDEFVAWVYRVIVDTDRSLPHLLALGDTTDRFEVLGCWRDIVGWHPDWTPSVREIAAIDGIAYLREPRQQLDATDPESGLRALRRCPGILTRFTRLFPDIALPAIPSTGPTL